jgi:hypothetical protein
MRFTILGMGLVHSYPQSHHDEAWPWQLAQRGSKEDHVDEFSWPHWSSRSDTPQHDSPDPGKTPRPTKGIETPRRRHNPVLPAPTHSQFRNGRREIGEGKGLGSWCIINAWVSRVVQRVPRPAGRTAMAGICYVP